MAGSTMGPRGKVVQVHGPRDHRAERFHIRPLAKQRLRGPTKRSDLVPNFPAPSEGDETVSLTHLSASSIPVNFTCSLSAVCYQSPVAIRDSQTGDTTMAELAVALGLGVAGFLAYGAMFGCVYCNDGWLSRSFGKRGACSWHGGWRK